MPNVRFLTSVAGDDLGDVRQGEVRHLTAEQAAVWADGERAVVVREVQAETTDARPGSLRTRTAAGRG